MTDLSEKTIKAAQPGDVLKDATLKGLQLRVFPQSRAFYLYYRNKAGTQRRPKLGEYGALTLAGAREVARQLLVDVAMGKDPAAERQEARDELTLDGLMLVYKAKHLDRLKSGSQYTRRYDRRIAPKFGARKLSDIGHRDVEEFVHAIGAKAPIEANRVLVELSGMFNFAHTRLRPRWPHENPCKDIPMYPDQKRRRYMKGEEPAKIANILDREAHGRNLHSVAFIYLLILTGARRSEIANARWEWLDGNVLNLPDSKTGRKQVFLPEQAMTVLARLPRGAAGGRMLDVKNPSEFWQRVRREAGCPDLRLHDLRHSFASAAIGAGFTLAQIGELLGHKNAQTTMRYAHLVDEAALAASTATADRIMASMKKPAKETAQ